MSKHKDPKTVMRYDRGRENSEMIPSTSSRATGSSRGGGCPGRAIAYDRGRENLDQDADNFLK